MRPNDILNLDNIVLFDWNSDNSNGNCNLSKKKSDVNINNDITYDITNIQVNDSIIKQNLLEYTRKFCLSHSLDQSTCGDLMNNVV